MGLVKVAHIPFRDRARLLVVKGSQGETQVAVVGGVHVAEASQDGETGERYEIRLPGIYYARVVHGRLVEEGMQRLLGFA
jgi:hypothetical protein